MPDGLLIAKNDHAECRLLPRMANRPSLVTGATGTGKTVRRRPWPSIFPPSACRSSWPTSRAISPAWRSPAVPMPRLPSACMP